MKWQGVWVGFFFCAHPEIDSIKISKALERTQINLEKMINDSSKVNECIKVIKKIV